MSDVGHWPADMTVTTKDLRHLLVRIQNSLLENAKHSKKDAQKYGSGDLLNRAAVYEDIAGIIGTWMP